jgi:hypothetical protein
MTAEATTGFQETEEYPTQDKKLTRSDRLKIVLRHFWGQVRPLVYTFLLGAFLTALGGGVLFYNHLRHDEAERNAKSATELALLAQQAGRASINVWDACSMVVGIDFKDCINPANKLWSYLGPEDNPWVNAIVFTTNETVANKPVKVTPRRFYGVQGLRPEPYPELNETPPMGHFILFNGNFVEEVGKEVISTTPR